MLSQACKRNQPPGDKAFLLVDQECSSNSSHHVKLFFISKHASTIYSEQHWLPSDSQASLSQACEPEMLGQ